MAEQNETFNETYLLNKDYQRELEEEFKPEPEKGMDTIDYLLSWVPEIKKRKQEQRQQQKKKAAPPPKKPLYPERKVRPEHAEMIAEIMFVRKHPYDEGALQQYRAKRQLAKKAKIQQEKEARRKGSKSARFERSRSIRNVSFVQSGEKQVYLPTVVSTRIVQTQKVVETRKKRNEKKIQKEEIRSQIEDVVYTMPSRKMNVQEEQELPVQQEVPKSHQKPQKHDSSEMSSNSDVERCPTQKTPKQNERSSKEERLQRKVNKLKRQKRELIRKYKADSEISKDYESKKKWMDSKQRTRKIDKSSSSDSESSSSSSSPSRSRERHPSRQGYGWRHYLREVTGYNPSDPKFRRRDREEIQDSNYHQIAREEARSLKIGLREDDMEMRIEREKKRRQQEKRNRQQRG